MAKEYFEKLSAFIERATAGRNKSVNLEYKHFFSGAALYVNERICISLTPVGLALKLPEETLDRLLKNKTAIPLRYFSKSPIKKGYVLFPHGIERGGEPLDQYVKASIAYVLTTPKPKMKQR